MNKTAKEENANNDFIFGNWWGTRLSLRWSLNTTSKSYPAPRSGSVKWPMYIPQDSHVAITWKSRYLVSSETLGYEAVLCPDLVFSILPRNIPGSAAVVSRGKHRYLGLNDPDLKAISSFIIKAYPKVLVTWLCGHTLAGSRHLFLPKFSQNLVAGMNAGVVLHPVDY